MPASQEQAAASIRRLLKQDKIWIDKAGVPHDLTSIDPRHRANLIPFLRAWAPYLFPAAHLAQLGRDENEPDALPSPEDLLERTPLMQRLTAMERGQAIERRAELAARNIAYEGRTGYTKVRPS